ncbi:hypothetical protein GMRT_12812 [Giardia muris]|uniref:Uncharacterized protein n=1 Tax=Giardia muris TaxID=5742 RepID=A0A4Z1SU07_GIAMU|nr:hypothetical protein GMRT_12812 [Giardia muris]|eukprot:TNJ27108.1 hypothetical protein GMRT_12812 [Giardia muris]
MIIILAIVSTIDAISTESMEQVITLVPEVFDKLQEICRVDTAQALINDNPPEDMTYIFKEGLEDIAERVNDVLLEASQALQEVGQQLAIHFKRIFTERKSLFLIPCRAVDKEENSTPITSPFFGGNTIDLTRSTIIPNDIGDFSESAGCIDLHSLFKRLIFTKHYPYDGFLNSKPQTFETDDTVSKTIRETNEYPSVTFLNALNFSVLTYPHLVSLNDGLSKTPSSEGSIHPSSSILTPCSQDRDEAPFLLSTAAPAHRTIYGSADTFFLIFMDTCKNYTFGDIYYKDLIQNHLVDFPEAFTTGALNFSYPVFLEQELLRADILNDTCTSADSNACIFNRDVLGQLLRTPIRMAIDIVHLIIRTKSKASKTGLAFLGSNGVLAAKNSFNTFSGAKSYFYKFMERVIRFVALQPRCIMPTRNSLVRALWGICNERERALGLHYKQHNPLYTYPLRAEAFKEDRTPIRPLILYIVGSGLQPLDSASEDASASASNPWVDDEELTLVATKLRALNVQIVFLLLPPKDLGSKLGSVRLVYYEQLLELRAVLLPRNVYTLPSEGYDDFLATLAPAKRELLSYRKDFLLPSVLQYMSPLLYQDNDTHISEPYHNVHRQFVVPMCVEISFKPDTKVDPLTYVVVNNGYVLAGSLCLELPLSGFLSLRGYSHRLSQLYLVNTMDFSILASSLVRQTEDMYYNWNVLADIPRSVYKLVLSRDSGYVVLDHAGGYIVMSDGTNYSNGYNSTIGSPYQPQNRTRILIFKHLQDLPTLTLVLRMTSPYWRFPEIALKPPPSLACPSGSNSDLCAILIPTQMAFADAYTSIPSCTYRADGHHYRNTKLNKELLDAISGEDLLLSPLIQNLNISKDAFLFARFFLQAGNLVKMAYEKFSPKPQNESIVLLQAIIFDQQGNVLGFPAILCQNIYSVLLREVLNQPPRPIATIHSIPCSCRLDTDDSNENILLSSYSSISQRGCIAIVFRLYGKGVDPNPNSNDEVVAYIALLFKELKASLTFEELMVMMWMKLHPNQSFPVSSYSLIFLDLSTENSFADNLNCVITANYISTHRQLQNAIYLLWYNGYLDCTYRQYSDLLYKSMTLTSKAFALASNLFSDQTADGPKHLLIPISPEHQGVTGKQDNILHLGVTKSLGAFILEIGSLEIGEVLTTPCYGQLDPLAALSAFYIPDESLTASYEAPASLENHKLDECVIIQVTPLERNLLYPIICVAFILYFLLYLIRLGTRSNANFFRTQHIEV